MGERAAIERLGRDGIKAVQAESRTNPDNDLYDVAGSKSWSVKSYEDAGHFDSVVRDHPGSSDYVVNSELHAQLVRTGRMDGYASKGIEVLDGVKSGDDAQ